MPTIKRVACAPPPDCFVGRRCQSRSVIHGSSSKLSAMCSRLLGESGGRLTVLVGPGLQDLDKERSLRVRGGAEGAAATGCSAASSAGLFSGQIFSPSQPEDGISSRAATTPAPATSPYLGCSLYESDVLGVPDSSEWVGVGGRGSGRDAPGCPATFCRHLENSRAGQSANSLTLRTCCRTRSTKSEQLPRKRTQEVSEMPFPCEALRRKLGRLVVGSAKSTQIVQVRHDGG